MKKYILILLAALFVPSCTMAADIDVSINAETKEIEAVIDIGRNEKSVSAAAKVINSAGNIDYLADGYTDENGKWSFEYNTGSAGYFDITAYTGGEKVTDTFFIGDTITVEAENVKRQTFSPSKVTADTLNGGAMIRYNGNSGINTYFLEYEFDAATAGIYELVSRTTAFGVRWTTDYTFSINGTVYTPAEYVVKIRDYTEYTGSTGLLKEYSLGRVYLTEGTNKLRITLDKNDPTESGIYSFHADCFKFELMGFEFDKITTNDAAGVYEQAEDVMLSIDFKAPAYREEEYTYIITDFENNTVCEETVSVKEGEMSIPVNLGQYDCGWYRFVLSKDGEEMSYVTFAVVPPYAERYAGETPFAADFASAQLVKTKENRRKLAKAAKLAGIQWVRERTSWNGMQTDENTEPYYNEINKITDIMHENGMKVSSILTNIPEWTDMTDLETIYNMQKKLSENTGIDMWEIDNENDGRTESGPADVYAAYYKAAALGNADAQTPSMMSMSAQCMDVDASYNRLFMKNDLISWSDIYNFHTHTTLGSNTLPVINSSMIGEHFEVSEVNGDRPFWITEAGLYIQTDENSEINDEQRAAQARYNIVSTVQSLAAGTEKHFWFIWPQFIENGKEMGTFDKYLNPNPSYQSQAVMSYVLGKAEIKGKLDISGAEGYVFDNGTSDVAVMWSENDTTAVFATDSSVTVTDIMGRETEVLSQNGSVTVNVGKYPVYVTFGQNISGYTPIIYDREHTAKTEYSAAERIVIQQIFEGQELSESRMGYILEEGKSQQMTVRLYNFNNSDKSVKLSGSLYGYDVIPKTDEITIPAMGNADVAVTLTPSGDTLTDTQLNLIFSVTADGEVSSPSAAYVVVQGEIKAPEIPASGYDSVASWKTSNIGSGGNAVLTKTSDGIHFNVSTADGNRWFYPQLAVNSAQISSADGISFAVKADTASSGKGSYNVYCYLSDGRSYSLGGSSGIALTDRWIQINRTWDEFVIRSTPLGESDTRPIDLSLVRYISVGGNFDADNVGYTLKHLGYFNKTEGEGITILSGWAGSDIAKAQIINNAGNIGEYVIIAAVYDGEGRLISLHTGDVEEKPAQITYDVNVKGDMRGSSVKLFAWNGFSGLVPLTECEEIR